MNWSFLENVLSGVNRYSTVIGRLWLSVVFLFRILVYVAAAEQVWKDETRDFLCNTEQPGCENACFDHFFPVSQVRLWAVQLIMVSTPSLLVALHVAYRERREAKHQRRLYADRGSLDGGLFCTYALSLLVKTGLEVGFLLAFYFLYGGFQVPMLLRCSEDPCPNTVDCYNARATEKKVFVCIMGVTSAACIALNVAEMIYIGWKRLWKSFRKRYTPVGNTHTHTPDSNTHNYTLVNNTHNYTPDIKTEPTANTEPAPAPAPAEASRTGPEPPGLMNHRSLS